MPRAIVLNSASKANTTGGTFADSLTANAGDSLAVANFNTGSAKVLEAWAIDSDSVAEGEWIYTRPESTHDQQRGLRFGVPALIPGGAAVVAAHNILAGYGTIDLYKSDVATLTFTSTAADDLLMSWITLYDDLPGVQGVFSSWAQIQAMQKSAVGIQVTAVASATPGAYGAQRAFNADDDRLHANTWYAILGATTQTVCTTLSLLGPDWGGQRVGLPMGALDTATPSWFVDQSEKWHLPMIPCFNSNNKGNVLVQIADGEASTSPKIDFFLYELTGMPGV
jgi:hypothetical protein